MKAEGEIREAPANCDLWSDESGDTYWVRGEHSEKGRWRARRDVAGEIGADFWTVPRAYRVWLVKHVCEEEGEWCWCSAFDGADNCIDTVPKGTPGAVPGWRVEWS